MVKKLGLLGILMVFGLLYVATSKDQSLLCEPDCTNLYRADSILAKNPRIASSYNCGVQQYCVFINDSTQANVLAVADTSCVVLKSVGVVNYDVFVIWRGQAPAFKADTLSQKKCL